MQLIMTSPAGHSEQQVSLTAAAGVQASVHVHLDKPRQTYMGVGGSLTQASAAALKTLSADKRQEILEAYFGRDGARLSLARTHIGSSDFSEYTYFYAPRPDASLESFSIDEDRRNGLLQLIKDARAIAGASFDLISSPWTAPGWMKDNGLAYDSSQRRGGRLLPEHYDTFARYFVKYIQAYEAEGVPVWAITPVNEPMGNAGNWESMDMSPEEQRDFIRVLGPRLQEAGLAARILIFDQNRAEMPQYTSVIFGDPVASSFSYGTATHWYNSTFKVYEDILEAEHARYPDKVIIHSEGTVDSVAGEASCKEQCPNPPCGCEEVFAWWQDDAWYYEKEATDWGWDWSDKKEDHPKYAPAFRYARDLVVTMAHWMNGWVDWNIVLNKRGGPNHVKNYCLAPVMVDGDTNTVYYSPLFYIIRQVSRYSRPGGSVLQTTVDGPPGLHAAAIRNPDGTLAVHLFNESGADVSFELRLGEVSGGVTIPHAALQTIVTSDGQ